MMFGRACFVGECGCACMCMDDSIGGWVVCIRSSVRGVFRQLMYC